jgi:hypothetical protein
MEQVNKTRRGLPSVVRRFMAAVGLFAALFLCSAFTEVPVADSHVTRFELAEAMEYLLKSNNLPAPDFDVRFYHDLPLERQEKIAAVLSHGLMTGFPDRTFRPDDSLPGVEIIFCLQKCSALLARHNPDSLIHQRLKKVFGAAMMLQKYCSMGMEWLCLPVFLILPDLLSVMRLCD